MSSVRSSLLKDGRLHPRLLADGGILVGQPLKGEGQASRMPDPELEAAILRASPDVAGPLGAPRHSQDSPCRWGNETSSTRLSAGGAEGAVHFPGGAAGVVARLQPHPEGFIPEPASHDQDLLRVGVHRGAAGRRVGPGVEAGEAGELTGGGIVAEDQLLDLPLEPVQPAPAVLLILCQGIPVGGGGLAHGARARGRWIRGAISAAFSIPRSWVPLSSEAHDSEPALAMVEQGFQRLPGAARWPGTVAEVP